MISHKMQKETFIEYVCHVSPDDQYIGLVEKLAAHKIGILHRAISVCLFDCNGRWLLQKRADCKYHSRGKIANTCCSHPRLNEAPIDTAIRRLNEELNIAFSPCDLHHISTFIYRADVEDGLIEHELDYLFTGVLPASFCAIHPNFLEVEAVFWMSQQQIEEALASTPSIFAAWFPHIYSHVRKKKYP